MQTTQSKKTIEVTVYDANPAQSGPCAWPDTYTARLVDGQISARCRTRVARDARACGQYGRGETLWLIARDADGVNLCQETVTI